MANTDSFIEEVNEELRRDQLYSLFKKWGWIPILLIIVLVGGAAYREYVIAQERNAAQGFGDALIAALEIDNEVDRSAALAAISTESSEAQVLLALLAASQQAAAADAVGAAAGLRVVAGSADIAPRYQDLMLLRAHLLDPGEGLENMPTLEALAQPGRPFRPLAMEQQAITYAASGDNENAISILRILEQDSQATAGLQQRATQLIVALEAGSVLQEAPEEEETPEPAVEDAGNAAEEDAAPEEPTGETGVTE